MTTFPVTSNTMKNMMKTTSVVVSSTILTVPWKRLLDLLPTLHHLPPWTLSTTQEWIWQATSPFDEASSTTFPSVDEAPKKKEKKKKTVRFSCGGLPSDVRHFADNSTINVLTENPIPYTQTEAFLWSGRKPHSRGSHGLMVGNRVYGLYPCACHKKEISEKLLSSFRADHWMINSGATNHLTPFKGDFLHLQDLKTTVTIANGQHIDMFGPGTVVLQPADSSRILTLSGVWYTPKAKHQLLSVPALAHRGYKCTIDKTTSRIWDNKG